MVCVCSLLFKFTYFGIVLGYPGYQIYKLNKDKKTEKSWILYFFLISIFTFLEYTVLFPVSWLLGKICYCMFPSLKACFALWLYYPENAGINLFEELGGKYIDLAYEKISGPAGGILEKIGIPNYGPGEKKKAE